MKLQLSLEILLRVLDYLNEAVYIVDQDGIVIYVNRAAARLETVGSRGNDWQDRSGNLRIIRS